MSDPTTAVAAANQTLPQSWKPFSPDDLQQWHKGVSVERHKVTKFAKIVLLGMFGLGSIWASTAEIGGAVRSSGIVITEASNRVIQNLEGGILAVLHVREGETVQQGQIVAELDTTSAKLQLSALEVREAIFRIQLARRQATVAGLSEIEMPTDIPQHVLDDPTVKEAIVSQKSEFEAATQFIEGEITRLEIQISNLVKDNEGLAEVLDSLEKQEAQTRELAMGMKELHDRDGTISKVVLNTNMSQLFSLEAQVEQTKVQIQQNIGRIEEAENNKQQVRLQLLQRTEQQTISLRAQLNDTTEQLARLRERIERAAMRSPVEGTVIQIHQKTLGSVLRPAETILEVFPVEDRLRVEARIKPSDAKDAFVGQKARIQFGKIFSSNPLTGVVRFLSDDVVPDPDDPSAPAAYIALVEVDPGSDTEEVFPGNEAQVYLETKPRTFLQIITAPFSRIEFDAFKD